MTRSAARRLDASRQIIPSAEPSDAQRYPGPVLASKAEPACIQGFRGRRASTHDPNPCDAPTTLARRDDATSTAGKPTSSCHSTFGSCPAPETANVRRRRRHWWQLRSELSARKHPNPWGPASASPGLRPPGARPAGARDSTRGRPPPEYSVARRVRRSRDRRQYDSCAYRAPNVVLPAAPHAARSLPARRS